MNKRKDDRERTDDEVLFAVDDVVMRGRMLNLTREGCMIAGNCGTGDRGKRVTVTLLEGVSAGGDIVWADGDRIGIEFSRPLGEVTVKYFQLPSLQYEPHEGPSDQFGRELPPMRPDQELK